VFQHAAHSVVCRCYEFKFFGDLFVVFLNRTCACHIQAELSDEIAEYSKFNVISEDVARLAPNEKYESLVDIGQKCFVASVVEAPKSSVYVHVGLGFFTELPWPAAVAVSGERMKIIQKKVSNTQDAIDRVQVDMAEVMVKLMTVPPDDSVFQTLSSFISTAHFQIFNYLNCFFKYTGN
jgi:prefoldin subunit 5